MNHFDNCILGFACAVMGIAGLFVAAHSGEGMPYYAGLAFFAFSILFIFLLIKGSFDAQEKQKQRK